MVQNGPMNVVKLCDLEINHSHNSTCVLFGISFRLSISLIMIFGTKNILTNLGPYDAITMRTIMRHIAASKYSDVHLKKKI